MSMPTPRQRLDTETIGGVTVVSFRDPRIVADEVIQEVGDQLIDLVDGLGRKNLLVNFGNVQAFSSAALGKLFGLRKKVDSVGGQLALFCIHPDLLELFRLQSGPGRDPLFAIYVDERAALASFGKPGL